MFKETKFRAPRTARRRGNWHPLTSVPLAIGWLASPKPRAALRQVGRPRGWRGRLPSLRLGWTGIPAPSCHPRARPGSPRAGRLRIAGSLFVPRELLCRRSGREVASPYDEGIAFVMTRGEDGASAVWTGHRRALRAFDSRSKPLDAPGGGDRLRPRQDTPIRELGNAIGLSSPVGR